MSNYDKSDQMDDSQFGTTNLIINYLPQSLTDNEFKKIFGGIGPLAQAKIIRNKSNSYSYGFGFVEYLNSQDAEKAIDQLNGLQLKNKRIKVAYSRPHSDDIKRAKLYIKNLSPDTTVEELNQVFSKYGTIIQSNIATNKGIAFILYDRREQAERAIENLQGTTLPGASLPLQIKFASSNGTKNFHNQNNQNLRQMRPNNNNYNNSNYSNNSYPNNNYYNTNNRSLNNANYNRSSTRNNGNNYQHGNNSSNYDTQSMENYEHSGNSKYSNDSNLYGGPIRNNQYGNKSHHSNRYNPMNNPSASSNPQYDYNDPYTSYSNNSKTPSNDHYSGQSSKNYYHQNNNYGNYGSQNNNYGNYSSQNSYQANYNNNGKNYPNASGGDQPGHIVFVYNIGLNTEEQIYNLFSKFGHVIKCNVIRKNKGFCFVTFSKYENAINAIEKTNNYNLNGNKLQVSFKK